MRKVRKAVFPVAGLGTRFLPATKAIPKEMLTVVDKPVIQYVVDEAREAGIEHFIFVTGRNKAVIEDHFDVQFELYDTLAQRGKDEQLARLQRLQPGPGQTSFTRQQVPLGLGHAVWCARDLVGNEPFALLLPDMIMQARDRLHEGDGRPLRGNRRQRHRRAGMRSGRSAQIRHRRQGRRGRIPASRSPAWWRSRSAGTAPSNHYINGRYILQPEIFAILENQERGAGNEIQLTDAMLKLCEQQPFYGYNFRGRTFDCGSPEGFIEANVAFALVAVRHARADGRRDREAGRRAQADRAAPQAPLATAWRPVLVPGSMVVMPAGQGGILVVMHVSEPACRLWIDVPDVDDLGQKRAIHAKFFA